jgi:hypothetical protein
VRVFGSTSNRAEHKSDFYAIGHVGQRLDDYVSQTHRLAQERAQLRKDRMVRR